MYASHRAADDGVPLRDTNGAIMERQSFENGRPNGPAETFDSEGSPLQQADQTASEKPGLLQRLFTGNA